MNQNVQYLAYTLAFALVLGGGYMLSRSSDNISPAADALVQSAESSSTVRKVGWDDLLPDGATTVIPFDAASDFPDVMASPFGSSEMGSETGGVTNFDEKFGTREDAPRADLAGQKVALAGYMTPISVENNKTRSFLLVPYVGACIHVPAPPPNQVVLVETSEPIDVREMWDPFVAVGEMSVETIDTGLAEVGYTMQLDRIEKYEVPKEG